MKAMKAKPRSLVLTLIFSAAVLAYAFLLFLPTQKSIRQLRKQLEQQRDYVVRANREYASYEQLGEQFETVDVYVQQWHDTMPRDADVPELLGRITSVAADQGVTLRRMNPGESSQLARLAQHSFQFELEGPFTQLFAFLGELEALDQAVWISQVDLESGAGPEGQLRCELVLTVFTQTENATHDRIAAWRLEWRNSNRARLHNYAS